MRNRLVVTLLGTIVLSFLVAAALFYSERASSINVSVSNVGVDDLESVVLQTQDGRYVLGDIGPGGTASTSIRPILDSNLTVFVGDTKELVVDTFVRRGYRGEVAINLADQKIVSFQDNLYIGWKWPPLP